MVHSDLPLADALHSQSKGSLQPCAELKGIAADLDDVVDESAHGGKREGGGEQHHIAELDKHLLVVLEGVLRRTDNTMREFKHQVTVKRTPGVYLRQGCQTCSLAKTATQLTG